MTIYIKCFPKHLLQDTCSTSQGRVAMIIMNVMMGILQWKHTLFWILVLVALKSETYLMVTCTHIASQQWEEAAGTARTTQDKLNSRAHQCPVTPRSPRGSHLLPNQPAPRRTSKLGVLQRAQTPNEHELTAFWNGDFLSEWGQGSLSQPVRPHPAP